MTTPIINIDSLSYRYPDGTEALENISFSVEAGERIGIMGANGAGKSTLLLHLNGIAGKSPNVQVLDQPVMKGNLKSIRRKVGLVFQNPDDQLFCPTAYDDVAFGPQNMGLSGEELAERVRAGLSSVGLKGIEHKHAGHLSQGQKKRLAIATVLAMQPEILVLDEPTIMLDPKSRREIIELLQDLGGTQIIATHDVDLVRTLCNRVLLMSAGRIVVQGPANDILSNRELLKKYDMT